MNPTFLPRTGIQDEPEARPGVRTPRALGCVRRAARPLKLGPGDGCKTLSMRPPRGEFQARPCAEAFSDIAQPLDKLASVC